MGRADPNSEVSETASPASENSQATYPGTRYGKGGTHPGTGDHSNDCKVVEASPGVG